MDKIHIRDLELYCNHGVYPEETFLGQKFLFDVTLYTNTRPAGLTDDLEKSINYGEISHQIKDYMSSHTYKLLEAAAGESVPGASSANKRPGKDPSGDQEALGTGQSFR